MGLDMNLYNSKGEPVMYWRKANQIRGWFISHGIIEADDNCVERTVTLQNLKDLVKDCFSLQQTFFSKETFTNN